MSSTYGAERVQLLQELDCGFQIPNTYVTAFAAGSISSPYFLQNSNWGASQFANRNAVFFRPTTATAADQIRYALALTTTSGLHTHSGANYTDTTVGTETVEVWYNGIRPDTDVLNAYNRALSDIYFHAWEPLSLAPDAAMRETGLTSWGTASSATTAKVTTATKVFPGFIRALETTNTGANGYLPSANIPVSPKEAVTVIALSRVQSGTSSQLIAWDITHNAQIDVAVTHPESTWNFSWISVDVPAGCYNISIRLGGTGASDVIDWQALWVYRVTTSNVMVLPSSYITENFEVESVAYSPFYRASVNAGTGVFPANAMAPEELPPDYYQTDVMFPAANPTFIQFNRGTESYFQYPLWLQLKLPYSERGTVTADTDPVYAPRHLLMPAWKARLLESKSMQARITDGATVLGESLAKVQAHSRARATTGPARRYRDVAFPYMPS